MKCLVLGARCPCAAVFGWTTSMLGAETPQEWIDTHLIPPMRALDPSVDEETRAWLTVAELLADDAAHLRLTHTQLMTGSGATPAAAAKWLVGWYPGRLAHAVGYLYAFASATVVVDPHRLRFGPHPDGWTQLIDFGQPQVAVVSGHPWEGQPGVRVVDDEQALAQVALSALVAASQGVVEVVRSFAKVGPVTLWSEVIDAFALAGISQADPPVDPAVFERLAQAVRVPGMPWRKYPELWVAEVGGKAVPVGQKGGCCLAYLCRQVPDSALDESLRAYRERFPSDSRGRNYCGSCSLLPRSECQDRQLFFVDS